MFTGIVEEVGVLRGTQVTAASVALDVRASTVIDAAVGDSILTDGVCLTVTALRPDGFSVDVPADEMAAESRAQRERPTRRPSRQRARRRSGRGGLGHT